MHINGLFQFTHQIEEKINWMFNLNHLYLFIGIIVFIGAIIYFFKKRNEKIQRKFLVTIAVLLMVLEILRFIWKIFYHYHFNQTISGFNWAWSFSFQMCATMVWITSISLFINRPKLNKYAYDIYFGTAMVGATLAFVYPDLIDGQYYFWHFRNLQTILAHAFLILVPVFLISTKKYYPRLKNYWHAIYGYFIAFSIALIMSYLTNNNFMFVKNCSLLEDIGWSLNNPWHLFPLAIFVLVLVFLLYIPFEIYAIKKYRNHLKV